VIFGPGLANIPTPMGEAYHEAVPLPDFAQYPLIIIGGGD